MKTLVWITTEFVGFHRWVDAPDEVAFLRDWHRHIFKVKIAVKVTHSDRDVEFFIFKKQVKEFLDNKYQNRQFESSCEMIAEHIAKHFNAFRVSVSEDGENGAIVCMEE